MARHATRRTLPGRPRAGVALAALALAALPPGAAAGERFWTNPAGGRFGDAANWDDGGGGVPGLEDIAVFGLDDAYEVEFVLDHATDRAVIRAGSVTFAMDPAATYVLLNPLAATPGVVVGETGAAELLAGPAARVASRYTVLGAGAGGVGALTVEGAEAEWRCDDELRVGGQGAGGLRIAGGGLLACGLANLGAGADALADVEVSGVETVLSCEGSLTVGGEGEAALLVEDGAFAASDRAVVARQFRSSGDVVVRGAGSTWEVAGTLDVGMLGLATLLVEDGGSVRNGTFATIGTFPWDIFGEGGVGTVTVRGAGSGWLVEGDLHVGFLSAGTLVVSRGGQVTVDGDLLRARGDGTTRMVIELGAADDYPQPALDVGGLAEDFEPIVRLVEGFVPAAGDRFEIVAAAGGVGTFAFVLPPLPNALSWEVLGESTGWALLVASACGPADLDGSGTVDFGDVLAVLRAWGPCPPEGECPADLDGSGVVDFADVLSVLADWGPCA